MKRLATLTPEEERTWETLFFFYVSDDELNDDEADANTWRDMQREYPRLKDYDGALP